MFLTKAEALRFENFIKAEAIQGKPWNPSPNDNRRLRELVQLWFEQHGNHLKDGEARVRKLLAMVSSLQNPIARQLKPEQYLKYRHIRSTNKINPKTLNNELGYLNAIYNELRRTGQIDYENPLAKIRPIKLRERELSFLLLEQINELLDTIKRTSENPHVLLITKLSLSTGCRWGEAEKLMLRQIGQSRITFVDTKSGKNRTVAIEKELEKELRAHEKKHGINGRLFTSSMGAFRRALIKTSIELPAGQAAHVLRHTFASHFIMSGGDIITLQRILGHSSITMTMRYAHLHEQHLEASQRLNPIALLAKA